MRIGAFIPTIGRSTLLPALVERLHASDVEAVHVAANRPDADPSWLTAGADLHSFVLGLGLYEVWNLGIAWGAEAGFDLLCVLNDDIDLHPGAVAILAGLVEARPDVWLAGFDHLCFAGPAQLHEVTGTYRDGGIGGFAFTVRPQLVPFVDTSFEWWGGDDDLVFATRQAGGVCALALGAHVGHPQPETSAQHYPELLAAKDRDRDRLVAKWGTSW